MHRDQGTVRRTPRIRRRAALTATAAACLLAAACGSSAQARTALAQTAQAQTAQAQTTTASPSGTATAAPTRTGSASAVAIPPGRSTQTIDSGATSRTVHLYRPAGLTSPAPLVVMLHGGYGSGTQAETAYRWDAEADRGHFLVAFPDGDNASWNGGGSCCGQAATKNVDDVAFLTKVVATIRGELAVDPNRIYVSGMSNGGVMAYRMACETNLFAAVGVDSTTMLVDCGHAAPASVLHIHGTADPIIPYQGGPGRRYSPTRPAIDGPSAPAVNAAWRAIDGCAAPTTTTSGTLTTSTATCPAGRTVELITIAGAGHGWPGAPNERAQRLMDTGPASTALDATDVIWRFLAAHPR
jgi:polyhydroxybutyrate depolymerase